MSERCSNCQRFDENSGICEFWNKVVDKKDYCVEYQRVNDEE